MQKKLVLAAAVAGVLAAPTAFAEATVYGHIDIGLQRVDPGEGYEGSDFFLQDQQGSGGSFFGFRASEDLGGGLRALGAIEMGLFSDTGNLDNAPDAEDGEPLQVKLAQRQMYVGLAGDFGTITGGRQYREAFLVGGGGAYNYTAAAIGVFFLNATTGVRQDNIVKYSSPSFGGANIVASYGFGEGQDAATDDDGYVELGVKYSAGPLRAGAVTATSTQTVGGIPEVDIDVLIAAGQYSFGPTTVYALFSTTEAEEAGVNLIDESSISFGVKQTVGNGDVVLQAGQRKNDIGTDADSTLIAVGYYHKLSKTTTVYTAYGTVDNDAGASLGVPRQAVATTAAGEDPNILTAGMRIVF